MLDYAEFCKIDGNRMKFNLIEQLEITFRQFDKMSEFKGHIGSIKELINFWSQDEPHKVKVINEKLDELSTNEEDQHLYAIYKEIISKSLS